MQKQTVMQQGADMYRQNYNPYTETPLVIIDNSGTILQFNTAAHDVCAALRVGKNIEIIMTEAERYEYHRLRFESSFGFRLKTHHKRKYDLVVDMSRDRKEGVTRVTFDTLYSKKTEPLTYSAVAKGVEDMLHGGADAEHMKHIYDAAVAADGIIPEFREKRILHLDETMDGFAAVMKDKLAEKKLTFTYEKLPGVTQNSLIYTEPCGLYLILAAISLSLGYITSDKHINLAAADVNGRIELTLSSIVKYEVPSVDAESFGKRAADVLFADGAAYACGYELIRELISSDRKDRMSFTLRLPEAQSNEVHADLAVGMLLRRALETLEVYVG